MSTETPTIERKTGRKFEDALTAARRIKGADREDYRAALDAVARAHYGDLRANGDYREERGYAAALLPIDGLTHYTHAALGAVYQAGLILGDLQRRAGRDGEERSTVRWSNPLGSVLMRLQWVRDRCVPKDITSRTQMGEELEEALGQLRAVTDLAEWRRIPLLAAADLKDLPYWKIDNATNEWVRYQPDGTEICRRPFTEGTARGVRG